MTRCVCVCVCVGLVQIEPHTEKKRRRRPKKKGSRNAGSVRIRATNRLEIRRPLSLTWRRSCGTRIAADHPATASSHVAGRDRRRWVWFTRRTGASSGAARPTRARHAPGMWAADSPLGASTCTFGPMATCSAYDREKEHRSAATWDATLFRHFRRSEGKKDLRHLSSVFCKRDSRTIALPTFH